MTLHDHHKVCKECGTIVDEASVAKGHQYFHHCPTCDRFVEAVFKTRFVLLGECGHHVDEKYVRKVKKRLLVWCDECNAYTRLTYTRTEERPSDLRSDGTTEETLPF
jgi:hypothetical protein